MKHKQQVNHRVRNNERKQKRLEKKHKRKLNQLSHSKSRLEFQKHQQQTQQQHQDSSNGYHHNNNRNGSAFDSKGDITEKNQQGYTIEQHHQQRRNFVEFVYPRGYSGCSNSRENSNKSQFYHKKQTKHHPNEPLPYVFKKHRKIRPTTTVLLPKANEENAAAIVEGSQNACTDRENKSTPPPIKNETIDDILFPNKKKNKSLQQQEQQQTNVGEKTKKKVGQQPKGGTINTNCNKTKTKVEATTPVSSSISSSSDESESDNYTMQMLKMKERKPVDEQQEQHRKGQQQQDANSLPLSTSATLSIDKNASNVRISGCSVADSSSSSSSSSTSSSSSSSSDNGDSEAEDLDNDNLQRKRSNLLLSPSTTDAIAKDENSRSGGSSSSDNDESDNETDYRRDSEIENNSQHEKSRKKQQQQQQRQHEEHTTKKKYSTEEKKEKRRAEDSATAPSDISLSSPDQRDLGNANEFTRQHRQDQVLQKAAHLTGLSVEDAARDTIGCRPRSNSTDGVLRLPRRGLCDEHMVLESHKWKQQQQRQHTNLLHHNKSRNMPPRGFVNLGNTCFLNATLQCLTYLPTFCQTVSSLPPLKKKTVNGEIIQTKKKISMGQRITFMMRALLRNAHNMDAGSDSSNNKGGDNGSSSGIKTCPIAPRMVVKALPQLSNNGINSRGYKFRPGRQEDAHEFLVHILDIMKDGELKAAGINQNVSGWRDRLQVPRIDETTLVHRIFGGYLRSQVVCTACNYNSNTYDPFLDLSLEVNKKSCNSISSAIHEFTRKEKLDVNNRWKCSGCKQYVCATKQLTIFRPPLSLCIQLKRFTFGGGYGGLSSIGDGGQGAWGSYGYFAGKKNKKKNKHMFTMMNRFGDGGFQGGGSGSKITKPIDFPANLKLPLSDGRKCEYELTGIVIHVGGTASSGHYTAYVKKPVHGGGNSVGKTYQWYHMDDSFVEPVSEKTVVQQRDAYVLFYCRKEVKLEIPPVPPSTAATPKALQQSSPRSSIQTNNDGRDAGQARSRINSNSADKTDQLNTQEVKKLNQSGKKKNRSLNSLTANDPSFSVVARESVKKGSKRTELTKNSEEKEILTSSSSRAEPPDSSFSSDDDSDSGSSSNESSSISNNEARKDEPAEFNKGIPRDKLQEDFSSSKLLSTEYKLSPKTKTAPSPPSTDVVGCVGSDDTSTQSSSDDGASQTNSDRAETEEEDRNEPRQHDHQNHERDNSLVSPEQKQQEPKTSKVVLDRGRGMGKLEVVTNRGKKTKIWKPKISQSKGNDDEGRDLLGNMGVGKWDDDDDGDDNASPRKQQNLQHPTASSRENAVKHLKKQEKSLRKRMYLDSWDAKLDEGKKKKVRAKPIEPLVIHAGKSNPFHAIQNSFQQKNHGRAKGYLRQQQEHDSGKKKTVIPKKYRKTKY